MDGGIRSGQDVIKALALGAKGVMIGRPYIYGLGAMGEAGVTMSLDIIRKELDMTMALCRPARHQAGRCRHPAATQSVAGQSVRRADRHPCDRPLLHRLTNRQPPQT